MNKQLLTAVSVIALMSAAPAIANTTIKADAEVSAKPGSAEAAAQSTGSITKDAKKAWKDIKSDTSEVYEKAKEGTKDAYKDIKAALISDDTENMDITNVKISTRTTANGMIGQPVYNNDERVGTIKDIIVNRDGEPIMVVVADGDFFGMGKLSAFDYKTVMNIDASGDIVVPLTEKSIDAAAEFSYDREDYSNSVRVIPSNGYSVAQLLDGQLTSANGKTLGQIDDIHFQNGEASHIVVGFDQLLGLGGEKAAMSYGSAKIVQNDDDYDFQLNAEKTAQFENYKKTATN